MLHARLREAFALVALGVAISLGADVRTTRTDAVVVRNPTIAAIQPGPVWVSRATWDPAEESVIVADPGSGRIYVYDAKGTVLRSIADPGRGAGEFTKPNYATLVGNRYAIATSMYGWIWFDRNLAVESAWDLDFERGEHKYSRLASSEFDFTATHLYTIGAVQGFDEKWTDKAVFAVSLSDRSIQQVGRISKDPDELSYYSEPPFNLSACAGKAWLLQMSAAVSIVEARDGGKKLQSFPDEFRRRPAIPRLVDANSVRSRHVALRNAPVAEGLFCADDRMLLLLARRPRAEGGLQWLVYPIDPLRDVLARPIELPTTAGEIVFVPGRKRWAVLEKGAMKYVGVQPLARIISFPRPALSATTERAAK
jgi:hypothetical protein